MTSGKLPAEAVEAVARRRAQIARDDLEREEARLAKHGRSDEGYRASARRDLQAAYPAIVTAIEADIRNRVLGDGVVRAAYHAYHTVATPTQPQMRLAIRKALDSAGIQEEER